MLLSNHVSNASATVNLTVEEMQRLSNLQFVDIQSTIAFGSNVTFSIAVSFFFFFLNI